MADISLRLQTPDGEAGQLLDVLLYAAANAERGGGIFAFATADGIRALVGSDEFSGLLKAGPFRLVVGVDSVTNTRALEELSASAKRHSGLAAHVLVHERSVLFHPKLSWFVAGRRLTLITGSGNLTVRGLRENWEAFTTIALEGASAARMEVQLDGWLTAHDALLRRPDDPSARERAALNTGRERDLKHARRISEERVEVGESIVLVAEAPKGGSGRKPRPSQVNFHKKDYETFFGAKEGSRIHVVLHCLDASGAKGAVEIRPIVFRKSGNYSLELTGFKEGRRRTGFPDIGVYLRLVQGAFLYQRFAYGDAGYKQLRDFLRHRWTGPAGQMRAVLAQAGEVSPAWPESPLWTAEIPSS